MTNFMTHLGETHDFFPGLGGSSDRASCSSTPLGRAVGDEWKVNHLSAGELGELLRYRRPVACSGITFSTQQDG